MSLQKKYNCYWNSENMIIKAKILVFTKNTRNKIVKSEMQWKSTIIKATMLSKVHENPQNAIVGAKYSEKQDNKNTL